MQRLAKLVFLALSVAATSLSAQQKTGLLLTTAAASSDAQQPFHAYWITRDGTQVNIAEGMRLLIHRKTGWWEVGLTELKHVNSSARSQSIWAAPLGSERPRVHVIPVSDDDPCPDDINTYSLSWAGDDYATLQHGYVSTCGGTSRSGEESFVVRLDDLRRLDQEQRPRLPLADIVGSEAEQAMQLGAQAEEIRSDESDSNSGPVVPLDEFWIVLRSKGHSRLLGTSPVVRGRGGNTYDIPYDPPSSLIGDDKLMVHWDAVLDQQPDALDAYTSPDGALLAIVSPRYLSLYELKEQQIGARVARIQVESSAVVSAQWATAADVDRWNETLVPALAKSPYQPQK